MKISNCKFQSAKCKLQSGGPRNLRRTLGEISFHYPVFLALQRKPALKRNETDWNEMEWNERCAGIHRTAS